jgi:hypothetical protein
VIRNVGAKVTIVSTTFRDDDAPAFAGLYDCAGFESPARHNVSIGRLLCATSPIAPLAFDPEPIANLLIFENGAPYGELIGGTTAVEPPAPDAGKGD